MAEPRKMTVSVSLPMELISEILAKLPIKDIIRFKTVSKAWNTLISSLHFSHQHMIFSQFHSSLFRDRIFVFVGKDLCLYFFNLNQISYLITPVKINLKGSYLFINIIGSCNGLILCSCFIKDHKLPEDLSIVLVNPTTLQQKLIPEFVSSASSNIGSRSYGFGYDSKANDFKIVCIAPNRRKGCWTVSNEVWVYSLRSNSWKIIHHDLSGGVCLPYTGVLINNHLLHWVFFGVDDNEYCIIQSFDVCTEQWSQVPLPASDFERFRIKLDGFDGRLYFRTICDDSSMFVMDVYGVKDSWVKLLDCFDEVFNDTYFVYPLGYSESRSEVFVEVQFVSRLYWCNLEEKTRREVEFRNVDPRGAGVECIRSLAYLPGCG